MRSYDDMNNQVWEIAEASIMVNRRTLLWGPPGTGKTTAGVRVGNPADVYVLTMTEDTPAAEIRGHYVPKGGEFEWRDGPGILAWDKGVRLVINEIDHANGDVHSLLHALLDDKSIAQLMLPNNTIVTPEDGFTVVATMNGQPDDLPPALLDRFEAVLLIDRPHPAAIAALPEDLRTVATDTVGVADAERRISVRAWHNFAAMREKMPVDAALYCAFGPRCMDVAGAIKLAAATKGAK